MMALNCYSMWGSAKAPQLGLATFQASSSNLRVKLIKHDLEKWCKWECFNLRGSVRRALRPNEEEKPVVNGFDVNGFESFRDAIRVRDEMTALEEYIHSVDFNHRPRPRPKPLIANDFYSSKDESKVRISCKGITGSYCEDAALKAYPNCETVPCEDFEAAFKAVESWIVDKAVLPVESSVAGSIHRNYDLLLRHKLHIVGEVQLLVNHCLLGLAGVRKEELKSVMSHPMALIQCKKKLSDLGITNISVEDTAAAAKKVALKGEKDIGAIASARSAKIYGLDVLAEEIQDDDFNVTRFLILGRDPIIAGNDKPYKTSIVFSLEAGNGALFKALGAFSLRNINLSKIESRPLKQRPLTVTDDSIDGSAKHFDYLFYIDFEASMADPRAQNALENLQEYTRFIRVLGCYPSLEDKSL